MAALGVGVRMTAMNSPRYVMEGTNITLRCEFDLEGDSLYSLLWWRGGSVLLRYTPPHGEPGGPLLPNTVTLSLTNHEYSFQKTIVCINFAMFVTCVYTNNILACVA